MYSVLLPVDRNEGRASAQANYVVDLPRDAEDISVHLLHVFDDDESLHPRDDDHRRDPEKLDSVAQVLDFFERHDIDATVIKENGDPTAAILEQAESCDADAIVLGGRKRSPAGKVLFGSVTMSVLRSTDIPIVVTGDASYSKI